MTNSAAAATIPGGFLQSVSETTTGILTQDRISLLKKYSNDSLAKLRAWRDFFDRTRFSKPANLQQVSTRVNFNLQYFQSNYLLIILGLLIYTLITNLFLTLTLVILLVSIFNISRMTPNTHTPIFGTRLVLTQQQAYVILGVCVIPLLWISSAGSAIFWIIGGGSFIILSHAALLEPTVESGFENPV
ncbi:PRA1 family protein-domain-containing protein [Hyaloraphidium curvatum]|nr:PRA1 family protein-domain-containing protein [Hyaloraphidium curvatum]